MKTYKAFDPDFSCLGFKYEVGETYTHEGKIEPCLSGFHACANPLDVLQFYPLTSRFAEVEQSGEVIHHDQKTVSSMITIVRELTLKEFIEAAATMTPGAATGNGSRAVTTGYYSPATTAGEYSPAVTTGGWSPATTAGEYSPATTAGEYSPAVTTGYRSPVVATGSYSPAATTGVRSPAATTGYRSHAATTGDNSPAATTGENSITAAVGIRSRAKAGVGGAIVLAWYDRYGNLKGGKFAMVGEDGVKPDTWYELDSEGKFVDLTNIPDR